MVVQSRNQVDPKTKPLPSVPIFFCHETESFEMADDLFHLHSLFGFLSIGLFVLGRQALISCSLFGKHGLGMTLLDALVSRIDPKLSFRSQMKLALFPQTEIMNSPRPKEGCKDLFCLCIDCELGLLRMSLFLPGRKFLLSISSRANSFFRAMLLFFSAALPDFRWHLQSPPQIRGQRQSVPSFQAVGIESTSSRCFPFFESFAPPWFHSLPVRCPEKRAWDILGSISAKSAHGLRG